MDSTQVAERRRQFARPLLPLGLRRRHDTGKITEPALRQRSQHAFIRRRSRSHSKREFRDPW